MKFLRQNKYLFFASLIISLFISNNCIAQKESNTDETTGKKLTKSSNIKPSVSKIEVQCVPKREFNITNRSTNSRQKNISENVIPAVSLISNKNFGKDSSKMPIHEITLVPRKHPSNVTPTVKRVQ